MRPYSLRQLSKQPSRGTNMILFTIAILFTVVLLMIFLAVKEEIEGRAHVAQIEAQEKEDRIYYSQFKKGA